MTYLRDAALVCIERGWRVHPCTPDGKIPLTKSWIRDASDKASDVDRWWTRWPYANPAIVCGDGSFDCLDVDVKGQAQGRQLAARARAAGLLNGWTTIVVTPSGGWHLWFPPSGRGGGTCGPNRDLELKATGGYIMAPGSYVIGKDKAGATVYEGAYRVERHRDRGAPVDWDAIKTLLDPPPAVRPTLTFPNRNGPINFDGLIRHVAAQGPDSGNRNRALFWAACRAVEGGAGDDVFRALVDAALSNGLDGGESQARATVKSAKKKAIRSAA